MGKKRDASALSDEEGKLSVEESPASKKHKKHKKHKHKKKKEGPEAPSTDPAQEDASKPSIKLKFKIGSETLGTTSLLSPTRTEGQPGQEDGDKLNISSDAASDLTGSSISKKDKDKDKDKDTSDEEREWLNALEAGTLDDNGDVKKTKDPTLMTARQRALLLGAREEDLQQLPTGYKNQELTEEQIQRRLQKAKKRKQQAHEKREKDKKQTLERLLKKQEAKSKGSKSHGRKDHPMYRYSLTADAAKISVPEGFSFPYPAQKAKDPPAKQMCGVPGCKNQKKYSCSKTGIPLCSLACYKKNLSRLPSTRAVS